MNSSDSSHWKNDFHSKLVYSSSIFISFVSITLNILIIYLSFAIEAIQQLDFKWYTMHLAVSDIAFAATSGLGLAIHSETTCFFEAYSISYTFILILHGTTPILFNRYVKVCCSADTYERLFSNKRKFLVCLIPHIAAAFFTTFNVAMFGSVGPDSSNTVCIHEADYPTTILIAVLLAVVPTVVFSLGIRKKLKTLKTAQQNLELREKVKTTEFLLRAAIIQMCSPIVLQIPAIVISQLPKHLEEEHPTLFEWVGALNIVIFTVNPVWDALCTLLIIKPFRDAIIRGKNKVNTIVTTGRHTKERVAER